MWKFDKTVSVGNLITILLSAIAIMSWGNNLEKQGEINARDISYLREQQNNSQQQVKQVRDEIKSDLRLIDEKIDKLIERRQ